MVQEPQFSCEFGFVVTGDDSVVVGELVMVTELDIKDAAFTSLTITKRAYLTAILFAA
jgi:hypothetical protein